MSSQNLDLLEAEVDEDHDAEVRIGGRGGYGWYSWEEVLDSVEGVNEQLRETVGWGREGVGQVMDMDMDMDMHDTNKRTFKRTFKRTAERRGLYLRPPPRAGLPRKHA